MEKNLINYRLLNLSKEDEQFIALDALRYKKYGIEFIVDKEGDGYCITIHQDAEENLSQTIFSREELEKIVHEIFSKKLKNHKYRVFIIESGESLFLIKPAEKNRKRIRPRKYSNE